MRILITGATGFIGRMLCSSFKAKGDELCILTRKTRLAKQRLPLKGLRFIQSLEEIQNDEYFDVVINLAGAPISKRWTNSYKKTILQSRLGLTKALIGLFSRLVHKPSVFISGSAIGYYGPQEGQPLNEESGFTSSFSHDLCAAWESEALKAPAGIRVCLLRTGIVLGANGGALAQMRLPFLLGLGGPFGDGKQWMSWIHMVDMVRLVHFCIENQAISGPINATAPLPVINRDFVKTYAKVLRRPCFLTTPAWVLELVYGQMALELLLTGQKVLPEKLTTAGFSFIYPSLEIALIAINQEH